MKEEEVLQDMLREGLIDEIEFHDKMWVIASRKYWKERQDKLERESLPVKDQETLNYENIDLQEQVAKQAEEIARLRRWLRSLCKKIASHDQYMGLRSYPYNIIAEYLATKNDGA